MADHAAGPMWGIVTDINDPKEIGRVRIRIPGVFPNGHPEWCRPVGWPGAGALGRGSRYPLTVGAQVLVLFELGDLMAPPAVLPGPYGIDTETNAPGGPTIALSNADPNTAIVLWEDDQMAVFITHDPDNSDRRFVVEDKRTASNITMDIADGTEGKSVSITLEANTAIYLKSNGLIDLDAPVVQIKGRRVMSGNRTRPGSKGI